tara:strand:+ start:106 stop:354 length:249 start_codon:yes stop_codon:yes gene_type:complete
MKTAVSIPDELFEEAEKTAQKLGLPRSQFYARALEEFISMHDKQKITARLNKVYSSDSAPDDSSTSQAGLDQLRRNLKSDTW